MKFNETSLPGVFLIDVEPAEDDRGFFARAWCRKEFAANGLTAEINQVNISQNRHIGTVRGLHYQRAPHAEAKVIRCINGKIFDVAVDVRESSPNYLKWTGHELTADNRQSLFIPEGFAHGFLALTPNTEILYLISEFYSPQSEVGIPHNDPAIGIEWPAEILCISDKDASWPALKIP